MVPVNRHHAVRQSLAVRQTLKEVTTDRGPTWRWIGLAAILLLATIILFSCDNLLTEESQNGNGRNGQDQVQPPIGSETREFNARDMDDNWRSVTAELRGHEPNSAFLYVEQGESLGSLTPAYLLSEFTNKMRPAITERLGDAHFFNQIGVADDDRSIVILILDLGSAQNGAILGGYFDPLHAFDRSSWNPYSNEAPMVFLNSRTLTEGGGSSDANRERLLVTLVHELQHLNNFYYNVGQSQIGQMDTWIDEMLSAAAEFYYAGTQQDRIDYFRGDVFRDLAYNPYIALGQNHVAWGRQWTDILTSYASTHMKMHWLRLHENEQGDSIFRDIVLSDYIDARAVADSAIKHIAAYTGSDRELVWKQLHTDWLVANRINAPSGRFGYKSYAPVGNEPLVATFNALLNDLETTLHQIMGTSQHQNSYALGPGEAIYVEPDDTDWGASLPSDFPDDLQRYLRVSSDGWSASGSVSDDDELLALSYDMKRLGDVVLTQPLPLADGLVASTQMFAMSLLGTTSVHLSPQLTPRVIDFVFPAPNTSGGAVQSNQSPRGSTSRITPNLEQVMQARATALEHR